MRSKQDLSSVYRYETEDLGLVLFRCSVYSIFRITFWGALAMIATAAIGALFDVSV